MKSKRALFIIITALLIIFCGKSLNPFSPTMFNFHDETQPTRISEFILNINNGKIPPRLAPNFSFKMGYPVFNFYAPASYWLTSLPHFLGLDIVSSLKLSFLFAIILGFIFAFLFLKNYFQFYPALIGAVFYVTCFYFPVDIFVRGNLGESLFLALFPAALYFLHKNSQKKSPLFFVATTFVLSLTLTTHNLLSLVSIPILFIFILLQKDRKINFVTFILAGLLGSYFFIPFIMENGLTYATQIAKQTAYYIHFLCPYQLWQSPWGYGGSAEGCSTDGMSFKIGKPQLVFFILGILVLIWSLIKKRKIKFLKTSFFFIILSVFSLFMTTYQSKFIWDAFSPLLSLSQFPWRFISFSLLGVVFIASFFWETIKFPLKNLVALLIVVIMLFIQSKYFYKPLLSKTEFENRYLSQKYIEQEVAYKIPEYLPKTVDYNYWKTYDGQNESTNYLTIKNNPFEKEYQVTAPNLIKLNIHYFPFWEIFVNNKKIVPRDFDKLGRPILIINIPSIIKIVYNQTTVEKVANIISLATMAAILIMVINKSLWKKLNT